MRPAEQGRPARIGERSTRGLAADAGASTITAVNYGGAAIGTVGAARGAKKAAGKLVQRGRAARGKPVAPVSVPRTQTVAPKAAQAVNAAGRAAAKVADSGVGKVLNAVAGSKAVAVAAKVSMPLLAFRAGMNALAGYQADGMRGAGRGIVQTLDPTGLVSKIAGGDGRGVLERGYDLAFGRQPVVGAYLNEQARARTEAHEIAQAEKVDRTGGTRQAAPDDKGGNGQVKAYTRKDGTPVAGYARTPGMGI